MMRTIFSGLLSAVVVVQGATAAHAIDEVTRSSTNRPVRGRITDTTKDQITLKRRSQTIQIPTGDVTSIKWTGEPAQLSLARNDESGGRLQKALEGYKASSQKTKSSSEYLKADLQFLIARTSAKMALVDLAKLNDAVRLLETFHKQHPDSHRFYESSNYLGQLYLKQRQWTKAELAFSALELASSNDYKMAALLGKAEVLLLKEGGGPTAAMPAFDKVIGMKATGSAEKLRHEAMLGKVRCLQLVGRHADALTTIDELIENMPPEDATMQAAAYVLQGSCLAASEKPKQAVLAYLHVDLLFFKQTAAHAESLYHLSGLWEQVGQQDRATDARSRLQTLYPNSDWSKRLSETPSGP